MAASEELLSFDVATLGERLKARQVSPVELTKAYLDRIERTDGALRAYITVTAEQALSGARAAEAQIAAGGWRGPFHGVPVALKDLCYTQGIRTTAGSKILAEFVPAYDSTVWARLKTAGAVLLGKLNLHEFAYGVTSSNPHWGFVRNPYDTSRIPGGSSGGSAAAIVARSAAATIGTDTGGSIRIPAALCGCVGFKPTWSRVSRHGVVPLAYTLDHVGPITRTVRDAALMLQVIAGHDPNDSTSSAEPVLEYARALAPGGGNLKGTRLGVIKELNNGLSPDAETAFNTALATFRTLGAEVEEASVPSIASATAVTHTITYAEALEYHQQFLPTRAAEYGPDVRRLIEAGMAVTASAYIRAQRQRSVILADALRALDGREALLSPGCAIGAPKIGQGRLDSAGGEAVDLLSAILRFTAPFDATGQPALMMPTALSREGLPLAIQIIGRPFDESAVLRVAHAYESARGPLPPPKI